MKVSVRMSVRAGLPLVGASLLFMAGCTPRAATSPDATDSHDSAWSQPTDTGTDTVALNTNPPADSIGSLGSTAGTGSSRMLLSQGASNPFSLELIDGTTSNTLVIGTAGTTTPEVKVSRLTSPDRVVLDLPGIPVQKTQNFSTADAELVTGVRIGSHKNASRVVLDLAPGVAVTERVSKTSGQISLTLDRATTTTDQRADATLPTISDETSVPQHLLADASGPRVKGLTIDSIPGEGNMVVAQVDRLKKFEFRKTAPSEYVLDIEGASIDPASQQTVLAQANSGAIRSARPTLLNGNVAVRIFAQPEATLTAAARGDKIVVSAADATAQDFMAQAKAEVTLTPNKDDAKPAAEKASDAAKPAAEAEKPASVTNDDLSALLGGDQKYSGRLISLDLQDTDIDNALRIIAEVSNLNIIASSDVAGKVTLRLIDVPWDQALDVILKTNALDKVQEGNVVRIAPVEKLRQERETLKQAQLAEDELEPLSVRYVRVSYAKASDLKPLLETVITERGTVTFDERSNQIIIKDIKKGIKNASELIQKLDLRTPQVLLETQIVEANRSLFRDLGAELGFQFIQSPETGNPTGFNFPNSINIGGGLPGNGAVNFPAALDATAGSAMNFIFGSADGTKSLSTRITALEKEGRIRIVSRPAVATTNNKSAEISSIETIRVRKPSGGSSTVVGGNGGGGESATETIEVGITLNVTPQASPDYYVLLDINAESSSFGTRIVDNIPSVIERKATSTVLVSSGQTFAIGGIYKLTDKDSVGGVPFFKDIPVVGSLFRQTGVDNSDEELLFFITPRIVEGSFDDAAMTVNS